MGEWLRSHAEAFAVFRDVMLLVLGGITAYLAKRTIDFAKKQDEVTGRQETLIKQQVTIGQQQVALSDQHNALMLEQNKIVAQQAEIMRKQDEIVNRKTQLTLTLTKSPAHETHIASVYKVHIANEGKKAARGVHWSVGIPHYAKDSTSLSKLSAQDPPIVELENSDTEFVFHSSFEERPIFANATHMLVAYLNVKKTFVKGGRDLHVKWIVECEDDHSEGTIPLIRWKEG